MQRMELLPQFLLRCCKVDKITNIFVPPSFEKPPRYRSGGIGSAYIDTRNTFSSHKSMHVHFPAVVTTSLQLEFVDLDTHKSHFYKAALMALIATIFASPLLTTRSSVCTSSKSKNDVGARLLVLDGSHAHHFLFKHLC